MNIPIETLRNDLHPLPPKWAEIGKGKDSMDGYQELANAIVAQAGMDSIMGSLIFVITHWKNKR